mmetsp:Transcript_5666/g.15371  ORF Transcript_5666/g.15371 Transcript_5666/m.15371 type:complete len:292 (-) Transcript_5666:54-929(-)
MVVVPAREFRRIAAHDLHLESVQRHVLAEQRDQRLLMRIRLEDQIAGQQKARQEVLRAVVVLDVVEAAVGRVRGVPCGVSAVVLEEDVEVAVAHLVGGLEVLEGVLVPDDVDVLEEEVVMQGADELHAYHLGHHHCGKAAIAVMTSGLRRHVAEVPFIVVRSQTKRLGQRLGLQIRGKDQHLRRVQVSLLRRAHKVDQQLRLTKVGHHDDDGVVLRFHFVENPLHLPQCILVGFKVLRQKIPILLGMLFLRRHELIDTVGLHTARHHAQGFGRIHLGSPFAGHAHPLLHVI